MDRRGQIWVVVSKGRTTVSAVKGKTTSIIVFKELFDGWGGGEGQGHQRWCMTRMTHMTFVRCSGSTATATRGFCLFVRGLRGHETVVKERG